ncbi:MAG: hypothetical protein WCR69_00030 [Sulfuricurvum sp.]|jgi:antitoxin component of RelBE/YafQ-DinJ toxin-antitoxin module
MLKIHRGIPFELKLPNDETPEVMQDIVSGKNIDNFSLDELAK